MISVCIIIYNHEKYIERAINSVLIQETNFNFELIIANDYFSNRTDAVINKIITSHHESKRIKHFHHTHNLGMMANFIFAIQQCNGKYIAFCKGDDFWSGSMKSQKQIGFRESHDDYNICFHPVKRNSEGTNEIEITNSTTRDVTTFDDLIHRKFIYTVSCMTRRSSLSKVLPHWPFEMPIGDYPIHFLVASTGKVKMLPDVMANYRIHEVGVWSQKKEIDLKFVWLNNLLLVSKKFHKKRKEKFLKGAAKNYTLLLKTKVENGIHIGFPILLWSYYKIWHHRPLKQLLSPLRWVFMKAQ